MKVRCALFAVLGMCVASLAEGQTDPQCLITSPAPTRYLWGGELRQVHERLAPDVPRMWAVGDGGMLRTKIDQPNQSWTFLQTPAAAHQTLLDVWFLPGRNPNGLGWACGTGGVLFTITNWTQVSTSVLPTILDGNQEPATLWRVRFVDALNGYVCGLWTFKYTNDGGQSWTDVPLAAPYQGMNGTIEFYALDLAVGPSGGWIGVSAGQGWNHPANTDGVAFRVDTSSIGATWSLAFHETADGQGIHDPWDFEFEPNPADYHTARGYLVGGGITDPNDPSAPPHLGDPGAIFSTPDGGQSWTLEHGGLSGPLGNTTMYGVTALPSGAAVACGYQGQIWRRFPNPGGNPNYIWTNQYDGVFTGPVTGACRQDSTTDAALLCGTFGFLRTLGANGSSWVNENLASATGNGDTKRMLDSSFATDMLGLAVGQHRTVMRTTDGGCNWVVVHSVSPATGGDLRSVAFASNPDNSVAVGDNSSGTSFVYTSANRGRTWSSGSVFPSIAKLTDATFASATDVWAIGADSAGGSVLLKSGDKGVNWFDADVLTLPAGFVPRKLTFLNASDGILIGNDANGACVYSLTNASPGPVVLAPMTVVPSLAGSLFNDVAACGPNLANAEVLIAGADSSGGGLLLRRPAGGSFDVESLPTSNYPIPFASVAIAPGASPLLALVGMGQPQTQLNTPYLGHLLRGDFSAGAWSWQVHKSMSNKRIASINLVSPTRAWLLCRVFVEGGVTEGYAEFGTVADTMFVLWDPL